MNHFLDTEIEENDSGETTIRNYLLELLYQAYEQAEGFSGKRPFGDSGWRVMLEDEVANTLDIPIEDIREIILYNIQELKHNSNL